jgi:hypothetical protein
MSTFRWLSFFLTGLLLVSCREGKPPLEDFDRSTWQSDRHGCENKRETLTAALLSQKEKLLGLDELQMVKALGKPDQREIYERNEKFFYYFIQPARSCKEPAPSPKRLVIRFNAMGLAKEINVE